jgi:hypothetical protein
MVSPVGRGRIRLETASSDPGQLRERVGPVGQVGGETDKHVGINARKGDRWMSAGWKRDTTTGPPCTGLVFQSSDREMNRSA